MLSLHRTTGETLIIGCGPDEVRLKVTRIQSRENRVVEVEMSFEVPPGVPIDREEVKQDQECLVRRKTGESIIIGSGRDEVRIRLAETKPGAPSGKARLAIDAPPWVPVDREELRIEKLRSGTLVRDVAAS